MVQPMNASQLIINVHTFLKSAPVHLQIIDCFKVSDRWLDNFNRIQTNLKIAQRIFRFPSCKYSDLCAHTHTEHHS